MVASQSSSGAVVALDVAAPELLVTRAAPHIVLATNIPWLSTTRYPEWEVVGRSLSLLLQGDGTCVATCGALWSALQARSPDATRGTPPSHSRQQGAGHRRVRHKGSLRVP